MPIFSYACPECGFSKDYIEKFDSLHTHTCIPCDKVMVRQISSNVNFHFKGTGFPGHDMKRPK